MSLTKLTILKMTRLYVLTTALFLVSLTSIAYGNNGQIAYAYPIDNIKIDGDLSDWSDKMTKFPISLSASNLKIKDDKDLKAFFRVAYNLNSKSLYLALEVNDDSYVIAKDRNIAWKDQDRYLLYVDRSHLRSGSGNVNYDVTHNSREIGFAPNNWDPKNSGANWDNVELKISRQGTKTICEWKIELGDDIRPNKTIGLDIFLVDKDQGETDSAFVLWGGGTYKSAITTNLGGVILTEPNVKLGDIQGRVKWKDDVKEPLIRRVRISSVKHPKLWVLANVDKEGNYSLKMPVGDYLIEPPFKTSLPFAVNAKAKPLRIDGRVNLRINVKGNQVNKAPNLQLVTFKPPEYLIQDKGVLHNYDSSKAIEIDNFIETYRRYYEIPGVSVALEKEGKLVYHKTFGVKNNLTKEKVDDSTLFEAASITKPVFAFAAMRLVERGLLNLDKPLYEYLPFKNIADDERSKLLTARIILSHKSGLPNWAWGGPGGWENGGKIKLNFRPGEKFAYSGEAYNYLGRVLEKITGKKLNQILQEEVLKPMGMTNTYFSNNKKLAKVASIGHMHHYPMFWGITEISSPASSMHTEARDFSKFMIGLINQTGLKKKTYAEMLKTHTEIPVKQRVYNNGWRQSLGLGLFLEDTPYGKLLEHGGNNGDFQCKFGVIPEKKIGYAIYTNSNSGDKLHRALEIFLLYGNRIRS